MQMELSLSLELQKNAVDDILLRLSICNQSDTKLLLPYPDLTGLRFVNKITLEESTWCYMALIEGGWGGLAMKPGETNHIDYCLQPVFLVPGDWEGDPARWDGVTFGDDINLIAIPAGNYLVWYQLEVGQDYFDGVSHYRFRDIQREAENQGAMAWTGEQKSNRLHVVRG